MCQPFICACCRDWVSREQSRLGAARKEGCVRAPPFVVALVRHLRRAETGLSPFLGSLVCVRWFYPIGSISLDVPLQEHRTTSKGSENR